MPEVSDVKVENFQMIKDPKGNTEYKMDVVVTFVRTRLDINNLNITVGKTQIDSVILT